MFRKKKFQQIFCLLLAIVMTIGVIPYGYVCAGYMELQPEDAAEIGDFISESEVWDDSDEYEINDLPLSSDNFVAESENEEEIEYPNAYNGYEYGYNGYHEGDEYDDIQGAEIPIMPFMPYHSGIINGTNGVGTATWTFNPANNTVYIHAGGFANQQGRSTTSPWTRAGIAFDVHYIEFEGPVAGGTLLNGLFSGMPYLREIRNLHYLTTGPVPGVAPNGTTTFQAMFGGGINGTFSRSPYPASIDVSHFDTSNVTNFNSLFNGSGLTNIYGLENWDVSSATNVSQMFMNARNLEWIDTTDWRWESNVSPITGFNQMFEGTDSLHTIIGIETWYVAPLTSFNRMFRDALSIQNLDLSAWDVGNVLSTAHMFNGARSLQSVDTTGWNTGSVTNMNHMFANLNGADQIYNTTHALTSILGIENWNTENVTLMNGMFSNAFMLPAPDLSAWDTSSVTNMQNMFNRAQSFTSLDLSGWDVSSVNLMQNMFAFTDSLTTIGNVRDWDTSNVTSMAGMFRETAIPELNLSNWDTGNVTNMFEMFRGAGDLWRLNIRGFSTENIGMAGSPIPGNMQNMFMDTLSLQQITLGEGWVVFNGSNITNLPAVPNNGFWRNVGRSYNPPGTVSAPVGGHALTSVELMSNQLPSDEIADTWIWVEREQFPITFDLNGGNLNGATANITHNIPEGLAVGANRVPEPILRENFTFAGWRYEGQQDNTPNLTSLQVASWIVTEPRTFVAQWIGYTHTVIFDLNEGHVDGDFSDWIHTIPSGHAIGPHRVPTPSRFPTHSFTGWRYDGQAAGTPNLTLTEAITHIVYRDITFTAQWITPPEDIYEVVFALDGGTYNGSPEDISQMVYANQPVGAENVPEPIIRTNYTLAGWRYNGQVEGTPNLTPLQTARWIVTGPQVFTAQWEPEAPQAGIVVTVTYMAGGGIGGPFAVNVPAGSYTMFAPGIADISRAGFTFIGWLAESGTLYQPGEVINVTGATTLTAQWTQEEVKTETFTVTYMAGGGIGGPFEVSVPAGSYTLFAPSIAGISRAGFTFIGWLTEDGKLYQQGEAITVAGPTTLTAQWVQTEVETETFIVTYVAGIGIGGPFVVSGVSAGSYTLLALSETNNITARAGYRFIGWIVEGTTTLRQPGEVINVNRDLTITAQWQRLSGDISIVIPDPVPQQPTTPPTPPSSLLRPPTPQTPPTLQTPPIPPTPPTAEDPVPMTQYHIAYIIGYTDGYVRPNNNITRAEVATIFFRLISDEHRAYIWSQQNPFPDVRLDNWFNNAISTLTNDNLLFGYPDGYFRPNQAMTRAEFSALIVRIMGYRHATDIQHNAFTDTSGHWAEGYINVAHALGWVQGYGDGTFRPDRLITRAEVAALVNRALNRLPESPSDLLENMVIWPDNMNKNAWYYLYIQEATNSHHYEMKPNGINETWVELIENREWWRLERPDSTPNIFKGIYIGANIGITYYSHVS